MATDLDDLIVSPQTTILDTMRTIDRCGLEVALMCDRGRKLLSVITDGDIRRALIRGQGVGDAVVDVGTRAFTSVAPACTRADAVQMMVERGIKCVPVIDEDAMLVDLHTLHASLFGQRSTSWAVIMAGGKGERLGELTKAIPKPMLWVGDRPILERIVQHLVCHGIRRIFISVNYLGPMIEDHFGDGSRHFCRIEYLREREDTPLGTAGPLSLLPEAPTTPLLVMNGDLLTAINVSRMLALHRAGGFKVTIALREHVVKVPFGVAELDGVRIARLVEKPTLNYRINAGIYVLEPSVVARVPSGRAVPMTDLIEQCLRDKLAVGAYHMQESWNDIGLPEEYARVHAGQ